MALLRQSLKLTQSMMSIARVPVANYHEKVIDHYENPRNVGKMDPKSKRVGTGLVGAPACGDVMKLQIEVFSLYLSVFIDHNPNKCFEMLTFSLCPLIRYVNIVNLSIYLIFLIFVVNMSDKLL